MNSKLKTTFRTCGGKCPSFKDPLNCRRDGCPTQTVSVERVEATSAMICEHAFPWCRARLLHALGAAEEQGILSDVLSEILGDYDLAEIRHFREYLHRHNWTKK